MELTPENALSVQHSEWLQHPVTRQMISNLEKQKTSFFQAIVNSAIQIDNGELNLRCHAVAARTVTASLNMIKNTDLFLQQLNKPSTDK
jgi:hypothetical protein